MDFRVEIRRNGTKNLPENTFMNWLRDRILNENIKVNFKFIDSQKYEWLSDALALEIRTWDIKTPVFISAQTGTGKNTFIQKKLLKKVFDDNVEHNSSYKILLLSNRVALNRQSKYQYAQYLHELTGDDWYRRIFKERTIEGINSLTDFGIITICSYHQLYEQELLDKQEYKYVVCDECHFFTSDAKFNEKTDEILQYIISKGKNSIRIYMSATPETVFEAIIRAEMEWIECRFAELEKKSERRRPDIIEQFNIRQSYPNPADIISNINRNIDSQLRREKSALKMTIFFYYMSRNYGYIEEIYTYKTHEELAEVINASKDKWMIFVSKLPLTDTKDPLNNLNKRTVQLSRNMISTDEKAKDVYDLLVEKEHFEEDVLITTSLLDNGINICDKKLKNVVIEVFDRTEFIQMLGRVRIGKDDKINLYVREYTTDEIKKFLKREIQMMVMLLYMDSLDKDKQRQYWDSIKHSSTYHFLGISPELMFKISEEKDKLWTYNENVVIQMIDSASRAFKLIKNEDKNYTVKLNDTEQDRLIKVRDYYVHGEGKSKSWSRNIVDLIETELGLDDRRDAIEEEKRIGFSERHSEIEEKYSFKFNDDFLHYLYAEIIPKYFDKLISERVDRFKRREDWKYFALKFNTKAGLQELSPIEELRIIQDIISQYDPIDITREEHYVTLKDYYFSMADAYDIINTLTEQLSWVEKCTEVKSISTINQDNSDTEFQINIRQADNFDDMMLEKLRDRIISEQQFEENAVKQEYKNGIKKFEMSFLRTYGIKNDSEEAEWLSKNFCRNVGAKKLKDMTIKFDSICVTIISVQSKRDNATYYLLVKKGE